MLKKYSEFFKSVLFILDLALISGMWLVAYFLRFYTPFIPVSKGVPSFDPYQALMPMVLIVWGGVFKAFNLYRPRRISSHFSEILDITKACSFATLIMISLSFFLRQFDYSRLFFILFWALSIISMTLSRWIFREFLRFFRRQGYNQRFAVIVGAGTLGQELAVKLKRQAELGIYVKGYLTRRPGKVKQAFRGLEVLGTYDDLPTILSTNPVDYVFIALPNEEYQAQERVLRYLQTQTVNVHLVSDIYQFVTLQGQAELFDGLPLITIQATPLIGWNMILKRMADVIFAFLILIVASPFMLIITLLVYITSPGPVFYRQKRIGFDGHVFEMLKFRTMRLDAESETGAVWAVAQDPRRTWLGTLLRKTSLDELPQFWNVLKGDMSIVGPRPERPEFVEKYKETVPKYMLRHKIKAGITGLAQVKGWRGNTSIEERIKCDLDYIQNWSLSLDFKIMWQTLWKGFINKNAY